MLFDDTDTDTRRTTTRNVQIAIGYKKMTHLIQMKLCCFEVKDYRDRLRWAKSSRHPQIGIAYFVASLDRELHVTVLLQYMHASIIVTAEGRSIYFTCTSHANS
jgi:hypothetical protein